MDRGPTVVSLRFGHYTSWGNGLSNLGLHRWKRQLELGISLVTWRSSKCHEWSLTQSIGGGILTSGCLFRCRRLLVKVSITRWHCTIRMRSLINASLLLFWHAWAWLSMVALPSLWTWSASGFINHVKIRVRWSNGRCWELGRIPIKLDFTLLNEVLNKING